MLRRHLSIPFSLMCVLLSQVAVLDASVPDVVDSSTSLELDLFYGLVIPDSDDSRAAEIKMVRQLFNEDKATHPYRAATMQKADRPAEPPAPTACEPHCTVNTTHNWTAKCTDLKNCTGCSACATAAKVISVVIAYCRSPLGWLPAYLRGLPSINDLTIYSKCSHEDHLLQSAYIEELRNISDGRAAIKTLPNVGGCDHTYAYDMANRDWTQFAKAEHIVMYLKDNDQNGLCTANLDYRHWRVLKPSTLVQVAAVSGLGCPIRTEHRESLWHAIPSFRKWRKKSVHKRNAGTEVATAGVKAPFYSNFRNMGDFADKMGIVLPGRFVAVCYKGNFAVSGGQFSTTPGKVAVARRLERALSRGNNIEEGHFMERLWGAFLHVPQTMAQAESIDRTNELLRGDFDTTALGRKQKKRRVNFPGILADLQPSHKKGRGPKAKAKAKASHQCTPATDTVH